MDPCGLQLFWICKRGRREIKEIITYMSQLSAKKKWGGGWVGVTSDGLTSQGGSDNIPSHFILQRVMGSYWLSRLAPQLTSSPTIFVIMAVSLYSQQAFNAATAINRMKNLQLGGADKPAVNNNGDWTEAAGLQWWSFLSSCSLPVGKQAKKGSGNEAYVNPCRSGVYEFVD